MVDIEFLAEHLKKAGFFGGRQGFVTRHELSGECRPEGFPLLREEIVAERCYFRTGAFVAALEQLATRISNIGQEGLEEV